MSNITTFSEVTLKEITTPTALPDHGKVYTKADNLLYFQTGAGDENTVFTTALITFSHINFADPTTANYGDRRTRNVAGTGSHRFNFNIPLHYTGTLKVELIGFPQSGAPGTLKDIDISGNYTTADGNNYQEYTFSDTTSTYTIPAVDTRWALDLTSLLANIAAGTEGGIYIDHNSIGGSVQYVGMRVTSTP